MRTYKRTNRWLTFNCDLRSIEASLWVLLGESVSGCEHVRRMPLRPAAAENMRVDHLAGGVAAAAACDGIFLSENEIRKSLDAANAVHASESNMTREAENLVRAFEDIRERSENGTSFSLSSDLLCSFNAAILAGIPHERNAAPGEFRKEDITSTAAYRRAPAEDCSYLVDRMYKWLSGSAFAAPDEAGTDMPTAYAILRAVTARAYLAWISPFAAGNERTASLLEYCILVGAGVPTPAAHLLSIHYHQTRPEYLMRLEEAVVAGQLLPFFDYALKGFAKGLRTLLESIWTRENGVVWESHVQDVFSGKNSPSDMRQRHLALDIGTREGWIEFGKLTELSTRVAREYAARTTKTLSRDVHELIEMDLVVREGRRIRARREVIRAFTPICMNREDTLHSGEAK